MAEGKSAEQSGQHRESEMESYGQNGASEWESIGWIATREVSRMSGELWSSQAAPVRKQDSDCQEGCRVTRLEGAEQPREHQRSSRASGERESVGQSGGPRVVTRATNSQKVPAQPGRQ